jgi:hypothetical protein
MNQVYINDLHHHDFVFFTVRHGPHFGSMTTKIFNTFHDACRFALNSHDIERPYEASVVIGNTLYKPENEEDWAILLLTA